MRTLLSIDPVTGSQIASYPEMSELQLEELVRRTEAAFQEWRRVDFSLRANSLKNAAKVLRARQDEYACLMAQEMGKPLAQGRAEVEKCAWVCDYYADNGARFLAPENLPSDATKSYVTFQPLGIVLAVMPWNFPFWQVFRCAAPTLMAGNAIVLKHASNVCGCALAIEAVIREAGFPASLCSTALVGSAMVPWLLKHPLVKAVTLTGSTPAGQAVAAQAGSLLKKSVLELGGSDPYLILEDADLENAATACVTARLINAGQSCIAAKRLIVVEAVRKPFEALLVEKMRQRKMGHPLEEGIEVGPLARHDLRAELHRQVQGSVAAGAQLLLGGVIPEGAGTFYPPSVLTLVKPGMPAFDEELFGPVAVVVPARDEAEAIAMANHSPFGLGAAVFTQNVTRGERLAAEAIEAGCCFVNTFVRSDPRLPFGGIKQSGYGRELSVFGIHEFVNIKTVFIK